MDIFRLRFSFGPNILLFPQELCILLFPQELSALCVDTKVWWVFQSRLGCCLWRDTVTSCQDIYHINQKAKIKARVLRLRIKKKSKSINLHHSYAFMGVPWPEIWVTSVIGSAFAEVLVESKLSYLGKKNTKASFSLKF